MIQQFLIFCEFTPLTSVENAEFWLINRSFYPETTILLKLASEQLQITD
ncbi:MAG: hypothetical protein IGS23_06820 [Rivularia sp. T60_A2020_040]|nr:hypothetical protein [Rivularia sp. T60_A2020_040]